MADGAVATALTSARLHPSQGTIPAGLPSPQEDAQWLVVNHPGFYSGSSQGLAILDNRCPVVQDTTSPVMVHGVQEPGATSAGSLRELLSVCFLPSLDPNLALHRAHLSSLVEAQLTGGGALAPHTRSKCSPSPLFMSL